MRNDEPTPAGIPVRPFSGRLVLIGAGAGGPQALGQILPQLPGDLPGAIVVVQHMRPGFTRVLAELLNDSCALPVCEALDGQPLQSSRVLIAPAGTELTLEYVDEESHGWFIRLNDVRGDPERQRRVIDHAMSQAAQMFGRDAVGIVLTGMGDDGRQGMRAIVEAGGTTIAQDEESSAVPDMPSAAVAAKAAHEELPLWRIAGRIVELMTGGADAAAA